MRKVFLILSSLILITLFVPTKSWADNANPPKILDLIQVTQGPYKPGDLVTYKIVYTGGNPGLASADINIHVWDRVYFQESDPISEIHGNGLISFVLPALLPGSYGPITASIRDKTGLTSPMWMAAGAPKTGPLSFIVSEYEFKPIKGGEVIPSPLKTHTLDLQIIPKKPKIGDVFLLPKYSSVGAPVFYKIDERSTSICKIFQEKYDFPLLPGGELKIVGNGACKLFVYSALGNRASYLHPQIISGVPSKSSGGDRSLLELQIGQEIVKEINQKSITCIKGKTTKKVSGTNPKCPKGYKVKV